MMLLGLVATWIPAQRALSLDPLVLLREESDQGRSFCPDWLLGQEGYIELADLKIRKDRIHGTSRDAQASQQAPLPPSRRHPEEG